MASRDGEQRRRGLGRTWASEDLRRDTTDDPGTGISKQPKLAASSDGRVALAWEDDRAGYEPVYLRVRTAGNKREWGPEILAAPATGKLGCDCPSRGEKTSGGGVEPAAR